MPIFSMSQWIDRERTAVFQHVSNFENKPKWHIHLVHTEPLTKEKPIGLGSSWRETFRLGRLEQQFDLTIVAWRDNEALSVQGNSFGPLTPFFHIEFADSDGGTLLTYHVDPQMPVYLRPFLKPILWLWGHLDLKNYFRLLAQTLENQPQQSIA